MLEDLMSGPAMTLSKYDVKENVSGATAGMMKIILIYGSTEFQYPSLRKDNVYC